MFQPTHLPYLPEKGKLNTITSAWGFRELDGNQHFHKGLDISMKEGTPLVALFNGVVRYELNHSIYGNVIWLHDQYDRLWFYGHCKRFLMDVSYAHPDSDKWFFVEEGQIIGFSGKSGTKRPHLHFGRLR